MHRYQLDHLALLAGSLLAVAPLQAVQWKDLSDPEDGYFDASPVLDDPWGFLPLAVPITEPAVGLGVAVTPLFIQPNGYDADGNQRRPDIFGAGGLITENGSSGLFGFHAGNFMDNRLRTVSALFDFSLNLDFYSVGTDPSSGTSRSYSIDATGFTLGGLYQIGKSKWWAGGGYNYNQTTTRRRSGPPIQGIPDVNDYQISTVNLQVQYSDLNNSFTPTSGFDFGLQVDFSAKAIGSDSNWQKVDLDGVYYQSLDPEEVLVLGIYARTACALNDPPYYLNPFVGLRGVPAMRYQGECVAETELELRYQLHPRWSLLAFGGAGLTWSSASGGITYQQEVIAGGLGFRYLLARRYGLHSGVDIGYSEDSGSAFYIQIGTAWPRF
ncbi:BamA/TamA family outer membrane protein [Coraliomargarita akajimensis]|uniref:Glyceraldehyde 3-phosphate dehydrogenase n=1 Tax=Coraliomargarita akajimensis (strain DSM 45221 / IAM 15411 / JCM 23193 / KCTC 12865 / 04OKA010-24) TaxID=583355 RepID=D5EJG9_CORAD|nr:BamA/TamA family outer membrane protein [Coraliomargarita akajimensis]ADE54568.1 glyceraldehyde 3-phosphate dehydrogenase [Coraliomargarita akajimensis DSM 45221]